MSEAHPRCRRSHPWWRRWLGCSECSMERLFDISDTYERIYLARLADGRKRQAAAIRALGEESAAPREEES